MDEKNLDLNEIRMAGTVMSTGGIGTVDQQNKPMFCFACFKNFDGKDSSTCPYCGSTNTQEVKA